MNIDRKLIELVELHRIIYDKSCKDFKNIKKKNTIWEEIGKQLNTSAGIVQRRWKVLRDRYSKERRDMINSASGADGDTGTSGWEFYDSLSFLEPYIRSRRTSTNFTTGSEVRGDIVRDLDEPNSPLCSESQYDILELIEEIPTEEQSLPTSLPLSTPSLTPIVISVGESSSTTQSPTPSPSPTPPTQGSKRKQREAAVDDTVLSIATYFKNKTAVDSDMAFGNSIGLQLKGLPKQTKNLAKIKIMEILAEFDSE